MKSVGEAMAIGRTFQESLQKALRSLETGLTGLDEMEIEGIGEGDDKNAIRAALGTPTPDRLLKVAQAMRLGVSDEQIHASCRIDLWFLAEIRGIVDMEAQSRAKGLPASAATVCKLKGMGFSDARLGRLTGLDAEEVSARRRALGVRPVFKRIDTCAAEFASPTAYMYSTYETPFAGRTSDEAAPSARDKVVIRGGGPNRIGQGIEFDYCCCHAAFALREAGFETIMINCNPETVSTDYDTSDRLYFEPLTAEDVLEIIDCERANGRLHGVIVQFGGQTPLKLAEPLERANIPILGTSPDAIDLAEDRDRFKKLLERLELRQAHSGIATSPARAHSIAETIGYPVVIRPSYVLGGRAMEIVHDPAHLERYVARLAADLDRPSELVVSAKRPLLIDRYLSDAIEVDVDCIADGRDVYIVGIMEHIEEAGVHSAGLAHGTLRRQGDRQAGRQDRGADHGRRDAGELRARTAALRAGRFRPRRGEGGRVSDRARSGRGYRARSRDEIDRRGHGARSLLRGGVRQEPARRRLAGAAGGHGLRLGPGCGQAAYSRYDAAVARARVRGDRDLRHAAVPGRPWDRGRQGQQGAGRPAPYRRPDHQRGGSAGIQHHGGGHRARRQPFAAPGRPLA